jgi:hypothetical protein
LKAPKRKRSQQGACTPRRLAASARRDGPSQLAVRPASAAFSMQRVCCGHSTGRVVKTSFWYASSGARAISLVLLCVSVGCRNPIDQNKPALVSVEAGPIIIVVADALRHDFRTVDQTPSRMSGASMLARDGTEFRKAFTTVPTTRESFSGLLSGFLTDNLGAVRAESSWVRRLHEMGYQTIFIASSSMFGSKQGLVDPSAVFDRTVLETDRQRIARPLDEAVNLGAANLRDRSSDRVLLVLHLFYPHAPYWEGAYEDNVVQLDRALARLIVQLRNLGLYDRSHVIFTSDHGESLQEHDCPPGHGWAVYGEETRIPLIWKTPGQTEGRASDELVRNYDIGPTLLRVVGSPGDLGDGAPRRGLPIGSLTGTKHAKRFVFQTHSRNRIRPVPQVGIRDDTYFLVRDALGMPNAELYDYVHDPAELYNLAAEPQSREKLSELTQGLSELEKLWVSGGPVGATSPDRELERRLRSLGYLGIAGASGEPIALEEPVRPGLRARFRSCITEKWGVYAENAGASDDLYPRRLVVGGGGELFMVENTGGDFVRLTDVPARVRGRKLQAMPYHNPGFNWPSFKFTAEPTCLTALLGARTIRRFFTDADRPYFVGPAISLEREYTDISYQRGLGVLLFSEREGIFLVQQNGREVFMGNIPGANSQKTAYVAARKALFVGSGTSVVRIPFGGEPRSIRDVGVEVLSLAARNGELWVGLSPFPEDSPATRRPVTILDSRNGNVLGRVGRRFARDGHLTSPRGRDYGPFGIYMPTQIVFAGEQRVYVLDSGLERLLSYDLYSP